MGISVIVYTYYILDGIITIYTVNKEFSALERLIKGLERVVTKMAKKQLPYRVISKPPEKYKLPDFFWEMMIKAAVEQARNNWKFG